jgi:hypothetical protein
METGRPRGNPNWTVGRKKLGGRKRGTRDKRNQVREETLARAYAAALPDLPKDLRDLTPLEGLLLCMRWSLAKQDRAGILAAAAAAAPHCHTKYAVVLQPQVSVPVEPEDDPVCVYLPDNGRGDYTGTLVPDPRRNGHGSDETK